MKTETMPVPQTLSTAKRVAKRIQRGVQFLIILIGISWIQCDNPVFDLLHIKTAYADIFPGSTAHLSASLPSFFGDYQKFLSPIADTILQEKISSFDSSKKPGMNLVAEDHCGIFAALSDIAGGIYSGLQPDTA